MNLSHELETAKTIARMAASICQSIQAELVDPAQKDGREPVTVADYASQALICNALAESYPDDAVLSEERSEEFMLLLSNHQRALVQRFITDALGGYVFEEDVCAWLDFGKQKQTARTWVIDPIDGTTGFLGRRHYCVAIGLLLDGQPVLGVLASPAFYVGVDNPPPDPGALTYAAWGSGAYTEPLYGGEPTPIRVSTSTDPRHAVFLTSYEDSHTDVELIERVILALKRGPSPALLRIDSQDKHALIAAGLGDMFLRLSPDPHFREKAWDHVAGTVIVSEAGGRVSDLDGRPLDFSVGSRLVNNRGVLVTNRFLHNAALKALQQSCT